MASPTEAFVVCQNLRLPPNFKPSLDQPLLGLSGNPDDHEAEMKFIAPFVACGDLEAWGDSDASHPPPAEHEKKDVVQSPTNPAYKEFLELKRSVLLQSRGLTSSLRSSSKMALSRSGAFK